jgi:glycine cleavage system H protein
MESFEFVDMFATKGIEYLLVLFFLAVFIVFLKLMAAPRSTAAAVAEKAAAFQGAIPLHEGLFYGHGHTSSHLNRDGVMSVGVSEFIKQVVGSIDSVRLPAAGTKVEKGDLLFTLSHKGKELAVPSPVSGTIAAVNSRLGEAGGAIDLDADDLWIVNMKPSNIAKEIGMLKIGEKAKSWLSGELGRLRDFLVARSPEPALAGQTLLDGGLPVKGVLHQLDDSAWEDFSDEFLNAPLE